MTSNTAPRKSNGVLPVSTSQVANETPKASKAKAPAQGKKVIIRRLPPGMTSEEFDTILGDEWKAGNGKVNWARFHEGEISNDPSNPSLPARCYLHVTRIDDIPILADTVQKLTWEDAKHTANDPALVGPPYLETAPYQKIPTTKRRTDPRQGTIDQDPDFMAFLSSLTQDPVAKETDSEAVTDDANKADVKVTTTPLIEYLKEKKANKTKESANAKGGKHARHESQGGKGKEDSKKKGKEYKAEKAEKSAEKEKDKAKEPVKLLTKKAAAQEAAEAAKSVASQIATGKQAEEAAPKSRRANIAAAAKILQRDLGLSPGSAHRRARQDAAKAEAAAKVDTGKEKETKEPAPSGLAGPSQSASPVPPSTPTAPKAQAAESSRRSRGSKVAKQNTSSDHAKGKGGDTPNTGNTKSTPTTPPVILKRKDDTTSTTLASTASTASSATPATPAPPTGPKAAAGKAAGTGKGASTTQKKGSSQPLVTAGATRAFVKHANPSQGVTEALLKQAMEVFGAVTFVEIDKRKGFAYVDFGDHDGLVKAITSSPISVAQGTVQVLERKETKKTAAATPSQPSSDKASESQSDRPKRGGRGRGRRGGNTANSSNGTAEAAGPSAPPAESNTAASTG
ncbi:Smg-4/UPF3 family-domain-containing protein [Biscogniauxia marginata]|nr:Smg-4/UPF3 family-domain-containing protein [Biscogniauxia marginata]